MTKIEFHINLEAGGETDLRKFILPGTQGLDKPTASEFEVIVQPPDSLNHIQVPGFQFFEEKGFCFSLLSLPWVSKADQELLIRNVKM